MAGTAGFSRASKMMSATSTLKIGSDKRTNFKETGVGTGVGTP